MRKVGKYGLWRNLKRHWRNKHEVEEGKRLLCKIMTEISTAGLKMTD